MWFGNPNNNGERQWHHTTHSRILCWNDLLFPMLFIQGSFRKTIETTHTENLTNAPSLSIFYHSFPFCGFVLLPNCHQV
jgi:hypothetical protein